MKKLNIHLLSGWLIVAVAILCAISLIAIASATPLIIYPNASTYWMRQGIFYFLSIAVIIFVYFFKNDRIYSGMWVIYGILMALLAGLAFEHFLYTRFDIQIVPFAKFVNGATSWYDLGFFDLQPSEFMKIAIAVVLAKTVHIHNETYENHTFRSDLLMLGKVAAISLPPCILIYLQNDSGVTLIVLAGIAALVFISGLQRSWFIIVGILVVAVLGIGTYLFFYQHDIFVSIMGGDHKIDRFYGWLDPEGAYSDQGYQLFNALLSFGSGGLTGHGFQSSLMNFPEAQTDFIFAVIVQGFGLIGGLITIVAVAFFDIVIIGIGFRSKNNVDKYFVGGLLGMLLFQQIWNMGMVIGLLPITGITLPFLSYGGSSLLSYMIAIGMLFDIERQTRIQERKNRYEV